MRVCVCVGGGGGHGRGLTLPGLPPHSQAVTPAGPLACPPPPLPPVPFRVQAPINFATVVTDFTTCHNTWFHPGATRCFVPTAFCRWVGGCRGL